MQLKKIKTDVQTVSARFNMQKTKETEQQYIKKAKSLLQKYESEMGKDWKYDPLSAVKYIGNKRNEWSKSTWRLYKSSLIFFMENYGPIEAVQYLNSLSTSECLKKTDNTSAKKKKCIPEQDLEQLINELEQKKSPYKQLTILWLKATILTGLRPIEWKTAILNGQTLIVKNAKNTNNRSFGKERYLVLSKMPQELLKNISIFLDQLEKWQKNHSFEIVYKNCRRLLYDTQIKIWPKRKKRYTLYSARHQFISNYKKTKIDRKILGALVGHNTVKTAMFHYSKSIYGYKNSLAMIETHKDIVSKVRGEMVNFSSFAKAQKKQGN